ncbi:MAG TPA: hypothetical protein VGA62_05135, partial [Acidimicrobiia bacterium]
MIVGATERQNIERVFAGEQLADGHPLAGVARYLDAVRTTCGARPAPAPRSDLAAVLRSGGAPAGRSVAESARSRPGRVRRVVAIAATLAVSLGATGGLAAASALPDSVQRAVADLADHFGVHLPQPELPTPTVGGGAAADRGLNSSPVQV